MDVAGVENAFFYFYIDVFQDIKVGIPFTILESDILKVLNVSPY